MYVRPRSYDDVRDVSRTLTRAWLSPIAIVIANLTSLAAVRWGGWNVHALLIVYWFETGIVSAVYFAKILRAAGTDDPEHVPSWATFDGKPADRLIGQSNRRVADTVILNFAGPWTVFGLFFVFIGGSYGIERASPQTVALATVSLLVYHVFSYWFEYVGRKEYERRGPVSLFVELAPRHLVVPLTWIFGLAATVITQNPLGAIVVLVFLKTCVDLGAHRRERALARA